MDIGKRIREIRTVKGLSMYRLTQITGISGHHIKGIEEGTRQPTIDTRTLIENFRTLDKEKADALLLFSDVLKK